MTDEVEEQGQPVAVSEQPEVEPQDDQQGDDQKMVPLAAMLATRKKTQEAEIRARQAEAKAEAYEKLLKEREQKPEPQEPEDPSALVEKQHLQQTTAATKREILETLYQDMNPKAVQEIEKYLDPILKKKPWLAQTVDTALNRYARAYEIVQDYMHLVDDKPKAVAAANTDGKRIVQNAQKPRSPVEVGKSARPEGLDYLKSIQGKKEFREYRQKLLRGES